MNPSIGRIVHYVLTEADVDKINKRRWDFERHQRSDEYRDTGYIAHFGVTPEDGEVVPLIITRVVTEHIISGQAFLDGSDTLWVSPIVEGEGPGTWSWPPRV